MKTLPRSAATLAALLLLAGCMATPAQRESRTGMDPRSACMAQCNRDANVCGDQQSAQSGNTSQIGNTDFGMGATCKADLQRCLARC